MIKRITSRLGLVGIDDVFFWLLGGMVVAAVLLTPSHRQRKAIEKCEAVGSIANCQEVVNSMSGEDVLNCIKDQPDAICPF